MINHKKQVDSDAVANSVVLPSDAAHRLRNALGLPLDAALRIAFIAGPGDVVGTYDYWSQGMHDPRTPVIAYSTMFYSIVAALGAEALVLVEQDKQPATPDPRFSFVYTARRRSRRGIGYRLDARAFTNTVLRHLRDYRPDVILVGTDAPDALIAALPAVRRVILTAHNTFWPMGLRGTSLKARLGYWSKARALRRIDAVVSTSDECAAQIAELGGPSGTRSFTEIPQILPGFYPERLLQASAVQRLLFVGRIEENKGIFDLISAFDVLATDHHHLTLDIVGSGSAEAQLRAVIATSPHAKRIIFHGQLLAHAVHDCLDAVDLLVCPTRSSFNEGLALVVVEAAVHGVPTLLSSIVPAKRLFPAACAEFRVDDTADLAATLQHLISNPSQYAALCEELATLRVQFRDRSKSWGSMLYCALKA